MIQISEFSKKTLLAPIAGFDCPSIEWAWKWCYTHGKDFRLGDVANECNSNAIHVS